MSNAALTAIAYRIAFLTTKTAVLIRISYVASGCPTDDNESCQYPVHRSSSRRELCTIASLSRIACKAHAMAQTILTAAILTLVAASHVCAKDPPVTQQATEQTIDPAGREFFEKHIRPVLAERCYKCHSTRSIRVRAELLLDSREGVIQGGESGSILEPGSPDESRLIEAIRWSDPDFQMPPDNQLSAEQIDKFEQWVKMGAPDPRTEQHTTSAKVATFSIEEARQQLWALRPVERPEVPTGVTDSGNPIDAFIAAEYRTNGLTPVAQADKPTSLRRVYLDLIGIPPSPSQLDEFLHDTSTDAYEKVVNRLLDNRQHGVRYARHWLDVLRYADVDERMIASRGIYLWRDWIINAINDDVPYDQFIRTQLTGYRSTNRTKMSATGYRSKAAPRPDDVFALGLLARGAVSRDREQKGELAISAVETVSSALLGMTVACAKCHDHVYDPITQQDYYAMKALFDPLVPRKITLATAEELFASGRAVQAATDLRAPIEAKITSLLAPYKKNLYDDRVAMLPADVRATILKPERDRTVAEQKIADDYFPILRIDTSKILKVISDDDREAYYELKRELSRVDESEKRRQRVSLAEFWTVEVEPKRETEKSYILTSGDPARPETDREVEPGWPFAASKPEFREGRVEAFSDWLTAPENPLFARVAVNRIWQWHFGTGLHKLPSDFGKFAGEPTNAKLLDWLAAEFVRQDFSMKAVHRLIVTSRTYRLASHFDSASASANQDVDAPNSYLWHFPLQRLSAEPIWDSIFTAAGTLDLAVGGPSFSVDSKSKDSNSMESYRRAAYLTRGYSTNREVMANFLRAFDVDDGRAPCPQRTQTVTATQGLFMMNSDAIEHATTRFAERLRNESDSDLTAAVDLAYRIALVRQPSDQERTAALEYLQNDPDRMKGLAWLMFNLDEFIYVK